MAATVLLVDDEPRLLDGLRRSLFGKFAVSTATSGADGLAQQQRALAAGRPFAVVVSDMRMPGMDGAEFLTLSRELDPDAVRMILSGQSDLTAAIAAVNGAGLFRFLTKPIPPEDLTAALDDAVHQYDLVTAERELLGRTLRGAVDVLTDLLSLAAPEAFSRTSRVRDLVTELARQLRGTAYGADDWRLPIAAMLSQIGAIAVPPEVLHKVERGLPLNAEDRAAYEVHPRTAAQMLERIPRLEDVARWVALQPLDPDTPLAPDAEPGEVVLAAATAFLAARDAAPHATAAVAALQQAGHLPGPVLEALRRAVQRVHGDGVVREVTVADVRLGAVLEQDVLTVTGMVLVRKGETVTRTLALRLENFAASVGVIEPLVVRVPE